MAHYGKHKPGELAKVILDLQVKHEKAEGEVKGAQASLDAAMGRLKAAEDELSTVVASFVRGFPAAVREVIIAETIRVRTPEEQHEAWEEEEAEAAAEVAGEG